MSVVASHITSQLCVTGIREWNRPVIGCSPNKRPVIQKRLPFDNVIMIRVPDINLIEIFVSEVTS